MDHIFIFCLILFTIIQPIFGIGEIIYAINAGGDSHIDVYGIRYEKDPLASLLIGTASDFGKQMIIGRVPPGDQILYQTERYHHNSFGYDIPLKGNGDYVIVIKFSEVYFNSPDQKVFDVQLNGEHIIVDELDIFSRVGRAVAHDEHVPFTVRDNRLLVNDHESSIKGNSIRIEFVKGYKDNPKVNAIYVMKGHIDDVPKLPPLTREEDLEEPEETKPHEQPLNQKGAPPKRRPSGPRTPDPYATDEAGGTMLPVFMALGAAVPLLFCLCRL